MYVTISQQGLLHISERLGMREESGVSKAVGRVAQGRDSELNRGSGC